MIQKKIQIINKLGLHARAAAKVVKTASQFASGIEIACNAKVVDAKNIMGVMMLAASQGTWVELIVSGEDELDALSSMETLIMNYFGEGE